MKELASMSVFVLAACASGSPPPVPTPATSSHGVAAPPPSTASSEVAPRAESPVAERDAGPSSRAERALVAALERVRADLARCHREAKNATGDMTMRVVIGVNKKVEATAIAESSTVPPKLARCIDERVRSLSVDTTPVTVPVSLHFRTSAYDGPTILIGDGPFDPGY